PGVAEAVDVKPDSGGHAELFPKIALAVKTLTNERLAAWDIAVRLDPPAADNAPAPFAHALFDLLEHGRIGFLHPLIERGGAGDKNEVVIFLHAIERGAEGRLDLVKAFLPLP